MKIRMRLGVATVLGLLVAAGHGFRADAQDPVNDLPATFAAPSYYWHMNKGGIQETVQKQSGLWAEVITANAKWIVIQDDQGNQYPIAADRIRQFLVRWPSNPALFTMNTLLEVTGPDAGSNTIVADHIDQFEDGAQSLVSPAVTNVYNNYGFNFNYGYNQTLAPWNVAASSTFQATYYGLPFGYAAPLPLHVVGRALGGDPIRVAGNGDNWYTVQPGSGGISITQVTIGNSSYAKRGDVVYFVLDNMSSRSLDITQLILYKKIPLRAFQP